MTNDDELVREMAKADWNAIRELKPHLPAWDELTREQIETGMIGMRAALARFREIMRERVGEDHISIGDDDFRAGWVEGHNDCRRAILGDDA